MIYRVEFRLDHAPDPIEFDLLLPQPPSEAEVLSTVIHKLKPHEPAQPVGNVDTRDRLMAENGLLSIALFDEKGAALFVI
jgi:hypothetical protein